MEEMFIPRWNFRFDAVLSLERDDVFLFCKQRRVDRSSLDDDDDDIVGPK